MSRGGRAPPRNQASAALGVVAVAAEALHAEGVGDPLPADALELGGQLRQPLGIDPAQRDAEAVAAQVTGLELVVVARRGQHLDPGEAVDRWAAVDRAARDENDACLRGDGMPVLHAGPRPDRGDAERLADGAAPRAGCRARACGR